MHSVFKSKIAIFSFSQVRLLVVALFVDVNQPGENYVCFIEAICLWYVPVTS